MTKLELTNNKIKTKNGMIQILSPFKTAKGTIFYGRVVKNDNEAREISIFVDRDNKRKPTKKVKNDIEERIISSLKRWWICGSLGKHDNCVAKGHYDISKVNLPIVNYGENRTG